MLFCFQRKKKKINFSLYFQSCCHKCELIKSKKKNILFLLLEHYIIVACYNCNKIVSCIVIEMSVFCFFYYVSDFYCMCYKTKHLYCIFCFVSRLSINIMCFIEYRTYYWTIQQLIIKLCMIHSLIQIDYFHTYIYMKALISTIETILRIINTYYTQVYEQQMQ